MKKVFAILFSLFCFASFSCASGSETDSAALLMGSWWMTGDTAWEEEKTQVVIAFSDDGTAVISEIYPDRQEFFEIVTPFLIDGESVVLTRYPEEELILPFTVTEGELRLRDPGLGELVFRRGTEEELAWAETLQPRFLPGGVSGVTVDYGTSERFSREDMDDAIEVIKQEFAYWYNCELESLSYASDEVSEAEYRSFRNWTPGKTYVDGIVFTSSFRTPPEDKGVPGSGLEADTEYTGWAWILMRTEEGTWELITWGYG